MRLTNEMRGDFADKVMKKIPVKSDWTRDKIIEALKQRLLLAQPIEVRRFAKEYPEQTNFTSVSVDWLRYKDDAGWHYGRVDCINGSTLGQINTDDLKNFYQEWRQEQDARKAIRDRIYEQACCANTVEQLKVIFPDLTGLMPKPAKVVKSLPVPAKGLTDDLVKIGLEIPQ